MNFVIYSCFKNEHKQSSSVFLVKKKFYMCGDKCRQDHGVQSKWSDLGSTQSESCVRWHDQGPGSILKDSLSSCSLRFFRGPAWLSGKVFNSLSRDSRLEPNWVLWFFVGVSMDNSVIQPSTGESQEIHYPNVLTTPLKNSTSILFEEGH